MAKSKIIKELATDDCGLDKALNRLYLIATSIKDEKLAKWIKNELNGYALDSELPKYRILKGRIAGKYRFVGYGQSVTVRNTNLPTHSLTDEEYNDLSTMEISLSIVSLIKSINNNEGLIKSIPTIYYSKLQKGTNINVIEAYCEISILQIESIIQTVKTRVIDSLVFLENKFGCLDELDIDVDQYEEADISSIQEKCAQIAYNGCTFNDFTKAKMKNSNVGNNNTLTQQTKVEISPTVNINNSKKSLISRIFSKLFNRSNNNGQD